MPNNLFGECRRNRSRLVTPDPEQVQEAASEEPVSDQKTPIHVCGAHLGLLGNQTAAPPLSSEPPSVFFFFFFTEVAPNPSALL